MDGLAVGGAVDHHENGDGANGRGKARTDEPAKAPVGAGFGMVGFVYVPQRAPCTAAIDVRQAARPLVRGPRNPAGGTVGMKAAIKHAQ